MTGDQGETRSVVVERVFSHPPEKVWRALTQPEIMVDWLMQSDFRLEVGHRFRFQAEWGEIDCKVVEIEPQRSLAYSWSAFDVETVVTFTLEPTARGTRLRMEQSGFHADQKQALGGAKSGWATFFDNLQRALDR
jgi:uncharacterized protein YndB with AHSA1/START domain